MILLTSQRDSFALVNSFNAAPICIGHHEKRDIVRMPIFNDRLNLANSTKDLLGDPRKQCGYSSPQRHRLRATAIGALQVVRHRIIMSRLRSKEGNNYLIDHSFG